MPYAGPPVALKFADNIAKVFIAGGVEAAEAVFIDLILEKGLTTAEVVMLRDKIMQRKIVLEG